MGQDWGEGWGLTGRNKLLGLFRAWLLFSHSVVSNSLEPQGLQHTRLPWPSLSLGSLHKLMFVESVRSSSHLIFCHPLFLLPSTFPIRIFSSESALHIKWSKSWSFSFSTSPSNEYSGLISFRIDWSDLVGQDREVEFYSRPLKSFEQKCDII